MAACLAVTTILAAGCKRNEPLSADAARAKGDELLRQMSQTVAAAQTFSYTAAETRERAAQGGTKTQEQSTRHVVVRRPNAIMFSDKGEDRDAAVYYDGKHVTLVSNRHKVWARGPMPPTLDEAMDFVSAEYAIQIPTADLLYSSPYDAMMTKETTGGWVDVQQVGERTCDHLAYKQEVVDWEIWLNEKRLPCQVRITYKNQPGQPVTTVVYSDFNPSAQVSDETFVATIPDGYQRIKIMRHATVEDPKVEAVPAGATAPAPVKR
jgi:hypothetical protein